MTAADRLRQLAAQATPGPWASVGLGIEGHGYRIAEWSKHTAEPDFALIALAPDLAVLCADLADALQGMRHDYLPNMPRCDCPSCRVIRPLFARVEQITGEPT
jgi:hypothetical protein